MLVLVIVVGVLAILLLAVALRVDMRATRRGRAVNINDGKVRTAHTNTYPTDSPEG